MNLQTEKIATDFKASLLERVYKQKEKEGHTGRHSPPPAICPRCAHGRRKVWQAVDEEQRAPARDDPPRDATEERVSEGKAAEEQSEHRGRGLAVGAEQTRQDFLPGDLVDQAAHARQDGERQSNRADHCEGIGP